MSYHQFGHFNTNINNNVSTKSGSGIAGRISSAFVRISSLQWTDPLCPSSSFVRLHKIPLVVLHRPVSFSVSGQKSIDYGPQSLTNSGRNQDLVKIRNCQDYRPGPTNYDYGYCSNRTIPIVVGISPCQGIPNHQGFSRPNGFGAWIPSRTL